MEEEKKLLEKLLQVQQDLKAPKGQYNSFGKYNYRSCEDILQAARPLCNANGLVLTMRDTVEPSGARYYIKAEAIVTDVASGETFSTQAMAREEDNKKGMDAAQVTGAASSYARKYALCALFAIDDTRDADSDEYTAKTRQNGAQSTQGNRTDNLPSGIKKGSESEILRTQALKKIQDTQKSSGIANGEVAAIIAWKYGKENFKALTLDEACDLAENIMKYVREVTAA
jgi:hypothetical protein